MYLKILQIVTDIILYRIIYFQKNFYWCYWIKRFN